MIRVSAPASAANLGPGFDVLALALDLRLTIEAEPADDWEVVGEQDEATHRVVSSLAVPPMRVTIDSDVPVGRGLGSSAALRAAIAAAALAADGEIDRDAVFGVVAAAEGHPDNAAAAVHGGLVAVSPGGAAMRLAVHPSLLVVVAVPAYPISTERAREVLPAEVDRRDAIGTASRLAFLIEGLRTADPATLAAAGGDEVFGVVAAAEGHPDNAAAAVHGGLVAVSPGGAAMRLAVHPSLLVVVAVPAYPISTERAREVLPAEMDRRDAVGTASRLSLLIEGLRTADPATLAAAGGDEVHERLRAPLSPLTVDLIRAARSAGALHAAWSGAGPAAIAFAAEQRIDAVAAAMTEVLQGDGEVLEPDIDRLGIVIEP